MTLEELKEQQARAESADPKIPPRMVLKMNRDGIIKAVSLSPTFGAFPDKALEYVSLFEHQDLLHAALKEAEEALRRVQQLYESETKHMELASHYRIALEKAREEAFLEGKLEALKFANAYTDNAYAGLLTEEAQVAAAIEKLAPSQPASAPSGGSGAGEGG